MPVRLWARLHETRSELKPVWDFTSVRGNFIISVHMTSGVVKLTSVQNSLRSNWPKWKFKPQWVFLTRRGGFQSKGFQHTKCVNEESSKASQLQPSTLNGSSLQLCQDLSQCWLDKIRKTFFSKKRSFWCSVGSTILPLSWVRTTTEVSEEEGSHALHFYRCFIESL